MLRRILVFVGFNLALGTSLLAADRGLSASLTVELTKVLVGTAPSLRLEITNAGGSPVALPRHVVLRVTPEGADPFIAINGYSQEHSLIAVLENTGGKQLSAGETATFEYRTRNLSQRPPWFYDPRLLEPGTYRLQMLLTDRASGISADDASNLESVLAVRAASREAVLTIVAPEGEDAIVWNELKAALRPRQLRLDPINWHEGRLYEIANQVVQAHPASAYAPYIAGSVRASTRVQRLELLERVIEAQPVAGAMVDEIWQQVASDEMQLAGEAELAKDLPTAMRWNAVARQHLERLSKSTNPDVKAWSCEQLHALPSPTTLQERLADE